LLEQHPESVKIVFKNFPLNSHPFARKAAAAALAAERQGKFWEYHDELFKNYRNLSDQKLADIAQKLELNMAKFDEDREDPLITNKISRDHEEGQELDIRGVPAVFINGRRIQNRDLGNLKGLLKKHLDNAK